MKSQSVDGFRTGTRREISVYLDSPLPQHALVDEVNALVRDAGLRARYVMLCRGADDRHQWQARFERADGLPLSAADVDTLLERVRNHVDLSAAVEAPSTARASGREVPALVDLAHLRHRSGGVSSIRASVVRRRRAGRRT